MTSPPLKRREESPAAKLQLITKMVLRLATKALLRIQHAKESRERLQVPLVLPEASAEGKHLHPNSVAVTRMFPPIVSTHYTNLCMDVSIAISVDTSIKQCVRHEII